MVSADVFNPDLRGSLERSTHHGVSGEIGNGPHPAIWLQVEEGQIVKASYQAHGCMTAMACGGTAVVLITGRTVEKALLLEAKDIDLFLGGIPEGKGDCADRVIAALHSAIGG